MHPRLLSNLLGLCAIAAVCVGVGGLFGLWVALVVLGLLLGLVGYLLALQEETEVAPTEVNEAVEAALEKAKLVHELELAGAVSQAEERGREEIRQQLIAERATERRAADLAASLT